MLIINRNLTIPSSELVFTYSRSSGPGGQNVNKVNSKATLRWSVTDTAALPDDVKTRFAKQQAHRINLEGELVITSQRYRDQPRNANDCLQKLRRMIEEALKVPKIRKRKKVSKAAKARRLDEKRRKSEKKKSRRERFD